MCEYEWDGVQWQLLSNTCTAGQSCTPPSGGGTYIGQLVNKNCTGVIGEQCR